MGTWCYHDFTLRGDTLGPPHVPRLGGCALWAPCLPSAQRFLSYYLVDPNTLGPPHAPYLGGRARWAPRPAPAQRSVSYYPVDPSARATSYYVCPVPDLVRAANTRRHIP
jgi:hypothetical protein